MKKIYAAGVMIFMLLILGTSVSAKTYYVNSKAVGGDGSKEKPFSYIQKAADVAEAGDIVLVEPGVYYEQIDIKKCGTKEKPIVFRATENEKNKVIITRADRDIREKKVQWTLEDEETGIYSIPYERNCASLLYNDAWCFLANNLEELKALKSGSYPIPQNSFCYDKNEKKLYVRLRKDEKYGSSDPNKNTICVGGPYYEYIELNKKMDSVWRFTGIGKDSYCMGVVTEAPAYVTIYGFTFETPGNEGVYIRGSEVTVSNCWFKGCRTGVGGGARSHHDAFFSNDITIEYCDWNLFPTFEDSYELIQTLDKDDGWHSNFYWYMKSSRGGVFDYEAGGFFGRAGNNWTLRNNKIASCLDGLSYYHGLVAQEQWEGTNKTISGQNYHYYENRFENCLDNAIETEDCSTDYNIHNNEFYNCFEPFSWQPAEKPYPSNIKLHHNQFCETEEYNKTRTERTYSLPSWLKIGSAFVIGRPYYIGEYDQINGMQLKTRQARDQGLSIYNNSVYMPGAYTMEAVGENDGNTYLANNLVYAFAQPDPVWKRTFIKPGTFFATNFIGYVQEANMYIASNPDVDLDLTDYSFNKGFGFKSFSEAGVDWDGKIFTLNKNSVGVNSGVQIPAEEEDTTYIGAVPYGTQWHIDYSPYPYGDVNCDGNVDLADLALIAEAKGVKEGEKNYNTRCDMNFDDIIDDKDCKTWVEFVEIRGEK